MMVSGSRRGSYLLNEIRRGDIMPWAVFVGNPAYETSGDVHVVNSDMQYFSFSSRQMRIPYAPREKRGCGPAALAMRAVIVSVSGPCVIYSDNGNEKIAMSMGLRGSICRVL